MNLIEYLTWPRTAITNMQKDIAAIRAALLQVTTRNDLNALEARMSELELQSRAELSDAIAGALGAYDAVVAERDQYKEALESADADKAAAVAAAVQDANESNDAGDAAFNTEQVEKLRRLQAQPTPDPTPEPAPEQPATNDVINPTVDPDA